MKRQNYSRPLICANALLYNMLKNSRKGEKGVSKLGLIRSKKSREFLKIITL